MPARLSSDAPEVLHDYYRILQPHRGRWLGYALDFHASQAPQ
ncbi:hypothetical protein ACFWM7_23415 [Streptomyces sp. NPDC058375]